MISLPKVTHKGSINLGNVNLSIVVLNDGRRLILKKSIYKLFDKSRRGRAKKKKSKINRLPFVNVDRLQTIIDKELEMELITIKFFSIDNDLKEGYVVDVIPKLCKLFLYAKKKKLLKPTDYSLVERAHIIAEELEGIHLKYFIDKAINFGFQEENNELSNVLQKHLSPNEFMLCEELFDPSCFLELFRLNGWEFNSVEIKKRPVVVFKWMSCLLFEQLPVSVTKQLENQSLFEGMSAKEIKDFYLVINSQLSSIQTLLKISNNMKELWRFLVVVKKRDNIKIKSPYDFDENGFTLEPKDDSFLSDFNKKLKVILSFEAKPR